jgi:hypothetical protein
MDIAIRERPPSWPALSAQKACLWKNSGLPQKETVMFFVLFVSFMGKNPF